MISQRLVRTKTGARVAAVEVLLNTRHISELIEKGEISEIKEALEKSMSPGSQTFEQALFKLFMDGKITQEEAMANADSATNMLWLINQATAGEITGQSAPAARGQAGGRRGEEGRHPVGRGRRILRQLQDRHECLRAALELAKELIARKSVTPEDGGCQEVIAKRLARRGFPSASR